MDRQIRDIEMTRQDFKVLCNLFEKIDNLLDREDARTVTGFEISDLKDYQEKLLSKGCNQHLRVNEFHSFEADEFSMIMGLMSAVFVTYSGANAARFLDCEVEEFSNFRDKFAW